MTPRTEGGLLRFTIVALADLRSDLSRVQRFTLSALEPSPSSSSFTP